MRHNEAKYPPVCQLGRTVRATFSVDMLINAYSKDCEMRR